MPRLVRPALPVGTLRTRPQPTLTATSVVLRPWADGDVPGVVTAYTDPDIQRWHCRTVDADEAVALIRQWHTGWDDETTASFAVTDPSDGGLLGRVGLREVDLQGGVAELAYWVLPSARGRGVATAAVRMLTHWAFDEIGFQRLELEHSVENTPSCKVALATGFAYEGTLRGSVLHADGWHDMHLHARLRTDA